MWLTMYWCWDCCQINIIAGGSEVLWSSIFRYTTILISPTIAVLDDQGGIGIYLSFVKVLFMLNMDKCFISGILGVRACNLSSFRFEMFKDCIKLK